MLDDRIFVGTARQIVVQMRSLSTDQDEPLKSYINISLARACEHEGVDAREVNVDAMDEDEASAAFLSELERVGLIRLEGGKSRIDVTPALPRKEGKG